MRDDAGERPAILVSNRQPLPIDETALVELAQATLIAEERRGAELSLSFVTNDEMARLHERFLDEPGPTDVLSFPLAEGEAGEDVIGDVVIAPAVATANNRADPGAEVRLLLVHGILHLLGYDHEEEERRARMWERQERYAGVRIR